MPKELDEKVTTADLQYERPSFLRYTVSQASKVERIGSRFLELVCSLPTVSLSAPCRRGDCRV